MSKKIQILALTSALLIALSAYGLAAIQNSRDIPASVSIKRSSVADIAYALYNATDGSQISQLDFGIVEPGASEMINVYIEAQNGTGTIYAFWSTSQLPYGVSLTARIGWPGGRVPLGLYLVTAQVWSQNGPYPWQMETQLPFTFTLQANADAPEINAKFTVSFALTASAQVPLFFHLGCIGKAVPCR